MMTQHKSKRLQRPIRKLALLLGVFCCLAIPSVAAVDGKISSALQTKVRANPSERVNVIVTFRAPPGHLDRADIEYIPGPVNVVSLLRESFPGLIECEAVQGLDADPLVSTYRWPRGVAIALPSSGSLNDPLLGSGITQACPLITASRVSGDSARMRRDHGGLITVRSAKAPRARGASRSPPKLSIP